MNEIIKIEEIEIRQDSEGRYCLNDLHKASGGAKKDQTSNWLSNQQTKELILELSAPGIQGTEQNQPLKVYQGGNFQGTYVCKELVYAYAMWISPSFHLKVIRIIYRANSVINNLQVIEFNGNIDGLVYSSNGIAYTTSRHISEVFGREHKDILRAICDKIESSNDMTAEFCADHIKEITYINSQNKIQKQYELDEQGFSFIALGLTGPRADEFKIKYIKAFHKMKLAIINMFKVKVIESILPQDNRLRQYIYVIKNPLNETIKIGVAQDVQKRIKQLETGAGIKLELIYQSMICSNAFNIERDVHDKFKSYRTFGEWFKIDQNEVIKFLESQTFVLKSKFLEILNFN